MDQPVSHAATNTVLNSSHKIFPEWLESKEEKCAEHKGRRLQAMPHQGKAAAAGPTLRPG